MTRRTGGRQQGAQDHAEGQHGHKTREHIAQTLRNHHDAQRTAAGSNGASNAKLGPRLDPNVHVALTQSSKSHIFSDRAQHDEADLNSEKTRLAQAVERDSGVAHSELARRSARGMAKRKS